MRAREQRRGGHLRGPQAGGHSHGKNVQHRYRSKSLYAVAEGEGGGKRERRDARRGRGFEALLAQDAKRRVPQTRTNGGRQHNLQAPAGALVCSGGAAQSFVR